MEPSSLKNVAKTVEGFAKTTPWIRSIIEDMVNAMKKDLESDEYQKTLDKNPEDKDVLFHIRALNSQCVECGEHGRQDPDTFEAIGMRLGWYVRADGKVATLCDTHVLHTDLHFGFFHFDPNRSVALINAQAQRSKHQEIVRLVERGESYATIAMQLHVSKSTAHEHYAKHAKGLCQC